MDASKLERLATAIAVFPWVWTRSGLDAANLRASFNYRDLTDAIGKFNLDADHYIYVQFRGNAIVRFSATLETSRPSNELSEDEQETTYVAFGADFTQLRDVFAAVFGEPDYSGKRGSPTFPSDEYSVYVAIWKLRKIVLRVDVEDEQEDSPIELTLSITPAD